MNRSDERNTLHQRLLERSGGHPRAARWATQALVLAEEVEDADQFLAEALRQIRDATGAAQAALAEWSAGALRILARVGGDDPPPAALAADALDREAALSRDGWTVAPLAPRTTGEVLALQGSLASPEADALAAALALGLDAARRRARERRRAVRLEAMLRIAERWNQTSEMEPLLTQMAEAATQLLDAERASIFLWDRPNHALVGRPALGVEGGELRIPDDRGVVGQVVHSGQTRRADAGADRDAIDRQVDRQLGFQTRTLLCVPLRGRDGEVLGAFETLNKRDGNFSDEDEETLTELARHAATALENTQHFEELLASHRHLVEQAAEGARLIGDSPAIEALRSTARRVADTELAVLILGENGTGKEVVAQSIHNHSRRRDQPFITVNCAALTETLLDSELFGHERGAFTDAQETRQGKFELASGGTLFLDEIGDLSLGGQAKLLRVLEEKVVVRVGGSQPIHTDARVVAATNQDLAVMVAQKRFRQDLYYRLNVVTLELPPLRERGDDILLLAEHFLRSFAQNARRKTPKLSAAARKRLLVHPWPGNVRELRNLMERVAYLLPGDRIEAEDLAFILPPGNKTDAAIDPALELSEATRQFQIQHIRRAIDRARGNMTDAAAELGLHRSNLYRKMRQLEMELKIDN
jgi:Nif-specific regulatory protein